MSKTIPGDQVPADKEWGGPDEIFARDVFRRCLEVFADFVVKRIFKDKDSINILAKSICANQGGFTFNEALQRREKSNSGSGCSRPTDTRIEKLGGQGNIKKSPPP